MGVLFVSVLIFWCCNCFYNYFNFLVLYWLRLGYVCLLFFISEELIFMNVYFGMKFILVYCDVDDVFFFLVVNLLDYLVLCICYYCRVYESRVMFYLLYYFIIDDDVVEGVVILLRI